MPFSESHRMGVTMGAEVVKAKKKVAKKKAAKKAPAKVKLFRRDRGVVAFPADQVENLIANGEWKRVD